MNAPPEPTQSTGITQTANIAQNNPLTRPGWNQELKLWLLFLGALAGGFFLHEIGHCVVAWVHGYGVIPTPMKEYLLSPIPLALENLVALGGIAGSVAALAGALMWFHCKPVAGRSALLAGTLAGPGFYALRFVLFGRGHDGEEFQQAQAALGLLYAGHTLDWFFVGLFLVAAGVWFWRARPPLTFRFAGRLLGGAVAGLATLVLLQSVNNAIFDPLFGGH